MIMISRELRSRTTRSGLVLALAALSVVLCSTLAPAVPQDQPGRSTFNTSCASCHGLNGTSTPVGKSLNAPDLNSPAVQNESDAQLRQIISDGKGNMPGFKSGLSKDQIDALVAYICTLAKPQQ